jgi:TM2 domain-containing membrane protein YozV
MSKNIKLLVGLLTLLPLIGFAFYIWTFIKIVTSIASAGAPDSVALSSDFVSIFTMLLLTVLMSIGLLVFYIVHAVKNKSLTSDERLMWILLFVFISTIAFMIYWALRIWNEEAPKTEAIKDEI